MSAETQQNEQLDATEKKLADLERFIARRFDEISMEIEATSQLIEMGEEDAQKRFRDMLGAMHAITFSGDGTTSANSGAELEAVIKETEDAATTIMDAAERIVKRLESEDSPNMLYHDEDIQKIILACSFQDLVSQRVSTSLKMIKNIEERLTSTLEKFGISIEKHQQELDEAGIPTSTKAKQDDFVPESGTSQADIDALFD